MLFVVWLGRQRASDARCNHHHLLHAAHRRRQLRLTTYAHPTVGYRKSPVSSATADCLLVTDMRVYR